MSEWGAELVLDAHAALGEGPSWDVRDNRLLWVDIMNSAVHRFDPSSGRDEPFSVGRHVGAVVSRASGGYVVALQGGLATVDAPGAAVELLAPVEADRKDTRMNDGKVDPAGRLWAGTMSYDEEEGAGSLYRLDPDHSLHRIVQGVTVSNGLGWSPDRTRMYFVDTPTQRVDVFDYDVETGAATNRRRLVDTSPIAGSPDGMTVDADGHLWVAFWGGSCVCRFSPEGELEGRISLPVSLVTSCAFGDRDLSTLFITSASVDLEESERAQQPHAGGVFAVRPGVTGDPPFAYAG